MHIVFLNGNEFRGSWRELTQALWHPLFIALILGMATILLLINPYDHVMPTGVMSRTLIIASSVVVFMGTAVLCLSQCASKNIKVKTLVILTPIIICTSIWGVMISVIAGGHMLSLAGWAQMFAFNFVFCISGEIFLASFLLGRIIEETGLQVHPIAALSPSIAPQPKTEPPAASVKKAAPSMQVVAVLGQTVTQDSIWHLKAEEHYVSLNLRDGTSQLLRGRLADAIAQLPDDLGLQVHRSHWVAKAALAELDRKRDGWRLRLLNGADIPVARNRQTEVRAWYEAVQGTP